MLILSEVFNKTDVSYFNDADVVYCFFKQALGY